MPTLEEIQGLIEEHECPVGWKGTCHDCGCEVEVVATPKEDGIHINGGALYELEDGKLYFKCDECFSKEKELRNYQECEVYARVVGYLRPVKQWNPGKKAEFYDRKDLNLDSY